MEKNESDIIALKEENRQLQEKTVNLKKTVKTLRRNFQGIVELLAETISLDNRFLGGHMKRTAEMAKSFCEFLKLPKDIIYLNYYAALLHDIGLVGTNSDIIEKITEDLSDNDKKIFLEHPVLGFEIINSIYSLKRIAAIIKSHHENYDGTGFPDKLASGEIPIEARVIRIVNDYDINKFKLSLTTKEACSLIESKRGKFYDPELVINFLSFISHFEQNNKGTAKSINCEDLKPGMYLNQDIIMSNGLLLIPSGVILDKAMIGKIQSFSSMLLGHGLIQVTY
ncbi:MAG: HD domain-containing protein [Spirochaetia bacterium]|jgi:putative nucleotidyltransferase with HDIG domain|nr:HD domain-containing protein [Spirochaetia bacterium]